MSQIEFPSGITWKADPKPAADFLGPNVSPYATKRFYPNSIGYGSSAGVVKINFDMSNVTDTSYMFDGSEYLERVVGLGGDAMANVTNTGSMFSNCYRISSYPSDNLPLMNLDNVLDANSMFTYFGHSVPGGTISDLSLPKVTTLGNIFSSAKVGTIGNIHCPRCTNFGSMMTNCTATSVGEVDATSCTNPSGPMGYSDNTTLTDMGGFKNLKVSWTSYAFEKCRNLTVESLMNIINNLYDWSGNTDGKAPLYDGTMHSFGTTHKMSFGSTNLAKLTDEQKAVATNKGWTLV